MYLWRFFAHVCLIRGSLSRLTRNHFIKLEMEGLIRREKDKIVLVHAGN